MFRILTTILIFSLFVQNIRTQECDNLAASAVNVSSACLKQMTTVCNNWQLNFKFFDASSRFLTSGMSYSNVIDYGNFPECMSIKYEDEDGEILGKFCPLSHIIANVLITHESWMVLKKYGIDASSKKTPMISLETLKQLDKDLRDIMIPQIPLVISKYCSCVPDACTPKEVGQFWGYANWAIPINGSLTLPIFIYTSDFTDLLECDTINSNTEYEAGDIVVIIVFCIVALLMIASTVYDALCQNFKIEPHHPLLLAFSILFNGKKLLHISNNTTEQIQVFNGMRFISMMWILAYHAVSVYQPGYIGLSNFPEVLDWTKSISNRYILSGLLAVDTFFFMAGFLLAFSYLKKAPEESFVQQLVKVPKMYLHRYLRVTPAVGMMYLVTITFYRFMGSGPMWTLVTKMMRNVCMDRWWEFFLYIQNYTNPDTMCVNPTWYLSADMQMFILAPLVLIPVALFIRKKFRHVLAGLIGLTVVTIVVPMLTRYYVEGSDKNAGNIYTSHERFNNFLIGITFGAVMRMYKHKPFIFSRTTNILLWIVVLTISIFFNLYWFDILDSYNLLEYTLFYGFYHPVWSLCLVFMVYSCYHDHGGIVQWILSRPSFQILGRLTYSMYVVHVIVEMYAGATLTTNSYFSNYLLFYNWCGHIIVTMTLSVIWVLAFEFPMLTIEKYILGNEGRTNKKERETN